MIKYNPEVHNLIYDDGCMIEFWKCEEGVVTICQMDWDDCDNCGFVCVKLEELKKIVEKCEVK